MRSITIFKDGTKALPFRFDFQVENWMMAKILSEHFFFRNECFPKKLNKKSAEEIIRSRLYFYGMMGQINDPEFFKADIYSCDKYNVLLEEAGKYVDKKYPELNNDKTEQV